MNKVIMMKRTTAAAAALLGLAAMAVPGGARAASTTGTAEFKADIAAVIKGCEVSVEVDDPVVSAAVYRKGNDGKLGTLKLTKSGESILTLKTAGAYCNLDGYKLVPQEKQSVEHASLAITRNGLLWPVDFVWSHVVEARLPSGERAEVLELSVGEPGDNKISLVGKPSSRYIKGAEYQNQFHLDNGAVNTFRYVLTGTSGMGANNNPLPFSATHEKPSRKTVDGITVPGHGYASLKIALSSIIGKTPYDPATGRPDDSKLEDGEEVVFTRTLTLVAP